MNVYDFDHTVYNGDCTIDFYKFVLLRKPYLIAFLPLQIFGLLLFSLGICTKEHTKEMFFIFIKYCTPLEETISRFWECNRKKIKTWYLQQKSESDVIISASPEFLLDPLVRGYLGVELIASQIDTSIGKYVGLNCYGEEKVRRFDNIYNNSIIDNFYSDSLSDASLAEKAKQSFIVKGNNIMSWEDYKPTLFESIKKTYFNKDFILFVFCGGMGTLTNFVFSLIISAALNPSISYVFGYAISLFVAYSLNAKLIFHKNISFTDFIKFVISYIPNFLILFTFVLVFLNLLHWNKVIVYALAGLLGLPLTFLLVKIIVFKKRGGVNNVNGKNC